MFKRRKMIDEEVKCSQSGNSTFTGVKATISAEKENIDTSIKRIKQVAGSYIPDNVITKLIHDHNAGARPFMTHLVSSKSFDELMDDACFTSEIIDGDGYRIGVIRFCSYYSDIHQSRINKTEVHIICDVPKRVSEKNISLPLSVGLNPYKLNMNGNARMICDGKIKLQ